MQVSDLSKASTKQEEQQQLKPILEVEATDLEGPFDAAMKLVDSPVGDSGSENGKILDSQDVHDQKIINQPKNGLGSTISTQVRTALEPDQETRFGQIEEEMREYIEGVL